MVSPRAPTPFPTEGQISMLNSNSYRFQKRLMPAVALLVTAMIAGGCGGGSGDDATSPGSKDPVSSSSTKPNGESSSQGDQDEGGSGGREMSLTFAMPEDGETPAGHRRLGAKCDDDKKEGSWVTYAIPEAWEKTSGGASGGGSPTDGALDHGFETGSGKVEIKVEADSRDEENQILDGSREPSESFDYTVSVGDETKTIVYTKTGTVDVGDQSVDVFKVGQEAFPEYLQGTTYVARLDLGLLKRGDLTDIGSSSRMTVSFDPEEVALSDDDVHQIIGSAALPECSRTSMVVSYEFMFNVDLNDDGKVSTVEDLRASR